MEPLRTDPAAAADAPTEALAAIRVLVAEDNPVNRKMLDLALRRFGCRVVLVDDGRAAVEAAARDAFDIILMDLAMPVMDGYEATRRLRAMGCTLPILVVSANAFPSDQAAALAAGATGFLAKPVGIDRLRARVLELTAAAVPGQATPV